MTTKGAQLAQEHADRLRVSAAAVYLGMSESTMNTWRAKGIGPRFVRIGNRCFYRKADLDAYVEGKVVETTDSRTAAA